VKKILIALVGTMLLASSCHSSGGGVLERGGSRIPSDSGVVTDATLERIQLDHTRNYLVDPNVESFTTRSHVATSLLGWGGKFVQIGLNAQKHIIWIAGIGTVVEGTPPVVYYSGIITKSDSSKHQVYFDDGTVLTTQAGVSVPSTGTQVVCKIDPSNGLVTTVTAA
jgi:hypothetical protein